LEGENCEGVLTKGGNKKGLHVFVYRERGGEARKKFCNKPEIQRNGEALGGGRIPCMRRGEQLHYSSGKVFNTQLAAASREF
jgi:hypothetical protein